MQGSLLLKVIGTLKKRERTRFSLFLSSPYFNAGSRASDLIRLWEVIDENIGKKGANALEKLTVYRQLFSEQKIYKGKLEKLMSQLLQLIHQFIAIERTATEAGETTYQLTLYQFYMERDLDSEARIRVNSQLRQQADFKSTSENFFDKFLLAQKVTHYSSLKNSRREDLNLPGLLEHLDHFYLFAKLEYSLQMLATHQWITPIDYGDALKRLDTNLKNIPKAMQGDKVFGLYLQAYHLLKDFQSGNAILFKEFLDNLEQTKTNCTKQQLKVFETLARNYCVHFYHQGKDEFIKLGFELYRKHLDAGLLYHQDKMLVGTFRNLVLLGIWNRELNWVADFIETHKEILSGLDKRELIYDLHLATLRFYQKSYDQALELLTISFEDQYLKLAARRLEIMIFYEQESPVFQSKLEAYKIYVYRIADDLHLKKTKDRNRNFVDLLKQIRHPKTLGNTIRIGKLLKKIQTTNYIAEKPWLIEKLEALRK